MSFRGTATGNRQAIDEREARRGLAVLADRENGCQILGAPSGRAQTFYGRDVDSMISWLRVIGDDTRIQVSLNPTPRNHSGAARAADFLKRRWIMVGVDPVQPDEFKGCMATEAERAGAKSVTDAIQLWLGGQGWPLPVVSDSGNGYHLLYRCDLPNDEPAKVLPNDEPAKVLLRRLMRRLKARFDGEQGKIEASASVVLATRVPGTWRRKGPDTDERPHRKGQLLVVPDAPRLVSLEQIAAVAGEEPARPAPARPNPFKSRAVGDRESAYAQRAIEGEIAKVIATAEGNRNNQIRDSAFALGQLIGGNVIPESMEPEIAKAMLRAAIGIGEPERKSSDTIARSLLAGKASPRTMPEPANNRNGAAKPETPLDPDTPVIIRACDVTTRAVEWLWPGRIPLGKMTTFAGLGGLGKTLCLCDISARVTTGVDWPDSTANSFPGQVIYISGEDDIEDTIVPRLMACGADLRKVTFLTAEVASNFELSSLKVLQAAKDQTGPNVRLVVIDPPTAYLGDVNDHKNAELRSLLSPIALWCSSNRVAFVFNTHLSKPGAAKVEAMLRVMGSVAWVNAVRAAHMFSKDPDNPERRLFVPMKCNIGPEQKGLAYKIVPVPGDLAKVEWLGLVDTTADQAINRETGEPRGVVAAKWLARRFMERRQWSLDELFTEGRTNGISRNAMFDAKRRLGIGEARRIVQGDGSAISVWVVPDNWTHVILDGDQSD